MRSKRVVGVIMAAAALLGSSLPAGAQTAALSGFKATALAESGRVRFTVPDRQLVEDIFDGGGAQARSVLEPYTATSYAALPWPGELVILGPSLFQAATGQVFPGSYPFYVSASNPTTPKQELKDPSGTYHLAASAADGQATGASQFAQTGEGGGGGTRVFASSVAEGNKVTAVAETLNEALNVGGGALRIASVRSRSETTYTESDAAPTSKTELLIEGGSAGDINFGFGPQGFVVAKDGTPIPAASGLEQLNTALAPAGISVRIANAAPVKGGAAADAFEIAIQQGAQGREFTGAIIKVRFGGATTSVVVGEQSDADEDDSAGTTPGPSPVAAAETPGSDLRRQREFRA